MVFLAALLFNLHRRSCAPGFLVVVDSSSQRRKIMGSSCHLEMVRTSQCKSAQQDETSWELCWFCWWQSLQDPSSISKSLPIWDWICFPVQQPLTCREMQILSCCTPPCRYGPKHKLGKTQLTLLSVRDKSFLPHWKSEDVPKSCNVT